MIETIKRKIKRYNMLKLFRLIKDRYLVVYTTFILVFTITILSYLNAFNIFDKVIYDFFTTFSLKTTHPSILIIESREKSYNHKLAIEKLQKLNPSAIIEKDLTDSSFQIAKHSYGVYRYQSFHFEDKQSLEYESFKKIRNYDFDKAEKDKFLINFSKYIDFPTLELERVLNDEVPKELIENKIVILGNSKDLKIFTPIGEINTLEFFAYSLSTLLDESEIYELNIFFEFKILLIITFLGTLFHRFLFFSQNSIFILLIIGFYSAVIYLFLIYLQIWLPIIEILIAIFGIFYISLKIEKNTSDKNTTKILRDITENLSDKILSSSFYHSKEYWSEVMSMINQTLDLNRAIFLEKVPDDHRLKEIISLNCDLSEIKELRRDYERFPYSDAIEKRGFIQIDTVNRPYLKVVDEHEEQYLSPLIFLGQIVGFWAFSIDESKKNSIEKFDYIISNYSEQISELIFKRQKEFKKEKNRFLQMLNFEDTKDSIKELEKIIFLAERRMLTLDNISNTLSTNTILYNIFGKVIQINSSMSALLKDLDITPYTITSLEFIQKLTDFNDFDIRLILQKVLIDQESFKYTIKKNGRDFWLNIKPILNSNQDLSLDTSYPFSVYGIFIEILDITKIKDALKIKEEAILVSLSQIEQKLKEQHSDSDILLNIDKLKNLTKQNVFGKDYYPINFLKELKSSISKLDSELKERNIDIDVNIEVGIYFVYFAPERLEGIFTSIFNLLREDSIEDSKIELNIKTSDKFLEFSFKNEGFGLPNEDFQNYLRVDSISDSNEYRDIIKSISTIKEFDGDVEFFSEVGEGISFTIYLLAFR